eukprot:3095858-Alexandrium_andersonii.AAC.1
MLCPPRPVQPPVLTEAHTCRASVVETRVRERAWLERESLPMLRNVFCPRVALDAWFRFASNDR